MSRRRLIFTTTIFITMMLAVLCVVVAFSHFQRCTRRSDIHVAMRLLHRLREPAT